MEEIKTEGHQSVRIRIEQPAVAEAAEPLEKKQSESLPAFYLILLILTYPISALSLYLSFAA